MLHTFQHFRRLGRLLALVPVLALATFGRPVIAGLPETIERIKPSLVVIGTYQETRSPAFKGLGTGFVVGDGTLVATNAHVAPTTTDPEATEVLTVLIRNANGVIQSRQARKIAADDDHDLALLKLNGPPLVPLNLGSSNALGVREGQRIAFSGFPILDVLGVFPTTSRGIISAIAPIAIPGADARQLGGKQIRRLKRGSFDIYQLDATAYPGNSGSPLYEADSGEIIGIINMVFVKSIKENALSAPSGITYAIPIRYLQALLQTAR